MASSMNIYACKNATKTCSPMKTAGTTMISQRKKCKGDRFAGEHVGEKTNRQRKRAATDG